MPVLLFVSFRLISSAAEPAATAAPETSPAAAATAKAAAAATESTATAAASSAAVVVEELDVAVLHVLLVFAQGLARVGLTGMGNYVKLIKEVLRKVASHL